MKVMVVEVKTSGTGTHRLEVRVYVSKVWIAVGEITLSKGFRKEQIRPPEIGLRISLKIVVILMYSKVHNRVSFETSFDSKQPKLVSALFETKRLFRLFRF
jgi:hypothetical protein